MNIFLEKIKGYVSWLNTRVSFGVFIFSGIVIASFAWYVSFGLQGVHTPVAAALSQATLQHVTSSTNNSLSLLTEPDDGVLQVKQAIEQATTSIDLVIYELQDPEMLQALADAKLRGVKVRVMLQNLSTFGRHPNQAAYDFLQSHGVSVHWAPAYFSLTHQKTLVVDHIVAFIMTLNLVPKYYNSSRDFIIIDADPVDVKEITLVFNADWNGASIDAAAANDLVWSPGSEKMLVALIQSAVNSIDVYNEEMADPVITKALEDAAKRGVLVRVDMTYATQWKQALNDLVIHGVQVKTYSSSARFYIHAKMVMVDSKLAFVGSENFSEPSLQSNRELGILVTKTDLLTGLEETFKKDWAGSRTYQ